MPIGPKGSQALSSSTQSIPLTGNITLGERPTAAEPPPPSESEDATGDRDSSDDESELERLRDSIEGLALGVPAKRFHGKSSGEHRRI